MKIRNYTFLNFLSCTIPSPHLRPFSFPYLLCAHLDLSHFSLPTSLVPFHLYSGFTIHTSSKVISHLLIFHLWPLSNHLPVAVSTTHLPAFALPHLSSSFHPTTTICLKKALNVKRYLSIFARDAD